MQFSRNNLLMADHVFLRIMQMFGFKFVFLNCLHHRWYQNNCKNFVSPVFILYPSSFVGTPKNEILGAALELCQLKFKQFSPDILKFSTKHEVILLLSTVLRFLALVCLYLMQGRVDWVLIIFGTQVINKKRPVRPVFPDYLSVSYVYVWTQNVLHGFYNLTSFY